jgi:hypothetical protein
VDANESSLGSGGEHRHEGHPEKSQPDEVAAEPIMARLPRSRPKRDTPRRKTARSRAAGSSKAPRSRRATGSSSAAARTRSRTAAARKTGIGAGTDRSGGDPAVFGAPEDAPGLPRLALDGAIEAAKLPVKVGANITFRALDAVTKSLRRR